METLLMNNFISRIEAELENKYNLAVINKEKCFLLPNGSLVHIVNFSWQNGVIAEYADSLKDANNGLFEDGDIHSLDDGEEKCIESILREIEYEGTRRLI